MPKKIKWKVIGLLLGITPLVALSSDADTSREQSTPQGPNPDLIYAALDVAEWRLAFLNPDTGEPRVGVTVFEKAVGGLLCRKSAPVVLEPVPRFQCYLQLTLTNELAMTLFHMLDNSTTRVAYLDAISGRPRIGVTVLEKTTDDVICQSVAPVIPDPVPRYACYTDIKEDTVRSEKIYDDKDRRKHWD
jgi:hypothetical protein